MLVFYERRIRRIFPALFPVIIFTLVVGAFLFDAVAFDDLGKSVSATALSWSNILFWRESGYFAAPSLQKPLLHTWSLAVEEQFYILFPIFAIVIQQRLRRQYVCWILMALTVSFLACIWGVNHYQAATFYLMPTRAWELLAGAILALGVPWILLTPWQSNLLSMAGLGLIVYAVRFYSEDTIFPGGNAVAPVLGACLVLVSNQANESPLVCKALAVKPLVFIGLISYSLYLWHWPLVAFAQYLMCRPFTGHESLGIIFTSLGIAMLSWRYVEQPFRRPQALLPNRTSVFAWAAAMTTIASVLGWAIHLQRGMAWRCPDLQAAITGTRADAQWVGFDSNETWLHGLKSGNIPKVIGSQDAQPSFALWGDSHAAALVTALAEKGKEYGVCGYNIGHGHNLRPLLGCAGFAKPYGINEAEQNKSVLKFIGEHEEINTVILAGSWGSSLGLKDVTGECDASHSKSALFRVGLSRTVSALREMGKCIVVVHDVPMLEQDPYRRLYVAKRFSSAATVDDVVNRIGTTMVEYESLNRDAIATIAALRREFGFFVVKPELLLFDHQTGRSKAMANGELLYIDTGHLSTYGSRYVAEAFDEVFEQIADRQKMMSQRPVLGR
jgi:peptidoglycan/LPS O-acetylase OafA/YrhL